MTFAHKNRFSAGGMDFAPSPTGSLTDQVLGYIDRRLEEKQRAETPRDYLGGSRLGEKCLRKLWYEYHHTPKDPGREFRARILRRFRLGHMMETDAVELLRLAGFVVLTHDKDGGQFGWSTAGGKMKGHVDGIIISGPVKLPYPLLFEHKILAEKYYKTLVEKGVRIARPVYFGQVQSYMGYMALDNALFMGINTNTSEIHLELIPLDIGHAQAMSDRGVAVISTTSVETFQRITSDPNYYECKHMCDYYKRCWG